MDLSEFEFIESIKEGLEKGLEGGYGNLGSSDVFGIGDDCAVIPYRGDRVYLVSKDLLLEGVHFRLGVIGLEDLGFKSVAVNLSDIAAMGGEARYIFVGIGVPSSFSSLDLSLFYSGVREAVDIYGLFLLGGDTCSSSEHFVVSVTVIGDCDRGKVLYRGGAKFGDNIYVTGTLGDSGGGFFLSGGGCGVSEAVRVYLMARHIRPSPRLEEMSYLSSRYNLTSAIDISDGLSMDLGHIVESSACGALLDLSLLPVSRELLLLSDYVDIEEFILSFGEDYEVLFTVSEDISVVSIDEFRREFGLELTKIGNITKEGLYIKDKGDIKPLVSSGYDHFL